MDNLDYLQCMKPYHEIVQILIEKDPVVTEINKHSKGEIQPTPSVDIYYYLLHSIVSQQLSVKVADVIWQRFLDIFPDQYPTEQFVLAKEDQELRAIGLSFQKLGYMKNVAEFSLSEGLSFESLVDLKDDEIIKYLTQIKGVGPWTVQMVLMFPMDRPDVFPVDDLGIQTKMKRFYGIEAEKKELRKKMKLIAENWKPYRTMASKLLWNAR